MLQFRVNDYLYSVITYNEPIGLASVQLVRGEIRNAPEQCKSVGWYSPNEPTSRILAAAINDSNVLDYSPEERLLLAIFGDKTSSQTQAQKWIDNRQVNYNPINVKDAHWEAKQR
jgi:hypothetical protein